MACFLNLTRILLWLAFTRLIRALFSVFGCRVSYLSKSWTFLNFKCLRINKIEIKFRRRKRCRSLLFLACFLSCNYIRISCEFAVNSVRQMHCCSGSCIPSTATLLLCWPLSITRTNLFFAASCFYLSILSEAKRMKMQSTHLDWLQDTSKSAQFRFHLVALLHFRTLYGLQSLEMLAT